MQDRFKFRVWDKSKNRYLDDTSLEERLYHNATELLGACLALNDGNVNYDYTFEQCTGVKDKNGKLIYEGDIVEIPSYPHNEQYIIQYNCSTGGFRMCKKDDSLGESLIGSFMTIIGNIHENPELLEENK